MNYRMLHIGFFLDKFETRRLNLLKIKKEKCEDRSTKLAEELGFGNAYVARLLAPMSKSTNKPISEKTAAHIENTFHLPAGWMDAAIEQPLTSSPLNFITIDSGIEDLDETNCLLKPLAVYATTILPPFKKGLRVIQVLTDKYYPRIQYGEYIAIAHVDTPPAGSSVLLFESESSCQIVRVESYTADFMRTNSIVDSNTPRTFKTNENDIKTYEILAILNSQLVKQ